MENDFSNDIESLFSDLSEEEKPPKENIEAVEMLQDENKENELH